MEENDESPGRKLDFPFSQNGRQPSWAPVAMIPSAGIMQQNIGRTSIVQSLTKCCPIVIECGDCCARRRSGVGSILHHQKLMLRGIGRPVAMQQPGERAAT